jgi:hypothetical protein
MSDHPTSLIETLVDAIKGYFSITGLMLVGVYMLKNADEAPFGATYIHYIGGGAAVLAGAIIGLWYSAHLIRKIVSERKTGALTALETAQFLCIVVLACTLVTSVILGSITMTCGALF